jgi:hypothetical protein
LQEDLQPVGVDLRPGEAFGHQHAFTSSIDRRSMAIAATTATTIASAPAATNERMVKKTGCGSWG